MSEGSRKRSREDASNDSMPLSKRINNLHLTNNGQLHGHSPNLSNRPDESYKEPSNGSHGHGPGNGMANGHHHHHPHQHQSHQQFPAAEQSPSPQTSSSRDYDPELTPAENPHYFHRNKLLYELHFIRSRRCHPESSDDV